jgi:group II intron reverse transcriptase/maturase
MSIEDEQHQESGKPEPARREVGEADHGRVGDEASSARDAQPSQGDDDLLGQALSRENMARAWKRVKANKGSAGVDGRTVQQTGERLVDEWPAIRQRLLDGTYKPEPVRRVSLPKPNGGTRDLGIPTVVDRLIQQALLQVLQPLIDPTFSEHSYGFRPGRSAHQAVVAARAHVQAGYKWVVDVDLEKFFDRVNHDILMGRMAKRIKDKRVLRLIRSYLQAGILADGVCIARDTGTPQGGPLSPLLANVLLDEVDRELERRGHRFVRYADDCNVYVRTQRSGERVMQSLHTLYAKLRLKINESKSAVAYADTRKFLGYRLVRAAGGVVKLGVAKEALRRFKDRIRDITRRRAGRSMEHVVEDLRAYMPGWRAYYALVETRTIWSPLEMWLRHRLRALMLHQWRHPPRIYRALRALGATHACAAKVAALRHGYWRTAQRRLHEVLTVDYFDQLGVPRLS